MILNLIFLSIGLLVGWALHTLLIQRKYVPKADHSELMRQLETKNNEVAALKHELGGLESKVQSLQGMKEEIGLYVEQISGKMLKQSVSELRLGSEEKLNEILNPVKEQLKDFKKTVEEARESDTRNAVSLKIQMEMMAKTHQTLSEDTNNLTKALRADPKKRGNWGEFSLEVILEKYGLEKGIHFHREVMGVTDEDKRRADVIIDLPGRKHLVIDSKVTLNAFMDYIAEEEASKAEDKLEEHVKNVKSHVNDLSKKRYDRIHNIDSPEFVLMFMPVEPAFHFAIKKDPELFQYAMDRNVFLVCASTLLPTMNMVASMWQHDVQQKKVSELSEVAGKLYDQVALFLKDMNKVEESLTKAKESYQSAAKRLASGNNNVLRLTGKIKDMGAKVKDRNDSSLEEFETKHALGA